MDLVFSVECQKGSMEHRMDLPHFGEMELVCDGGENLDYCKRSFSFWGEFWIGNGVF